MSIDALLCLPTGTAATPSHAQRRHQHSDWGGSTTPRGPLSAHQHDHHGGTALGSGPGAWPGFGPHSEYGSPPSVGSHSDYSPTSGRFSSAYSSGGLADPPYSDPEHRSPEDPPPGPAMALQPASTAPPEPPPATEYVINEHQTALLECGVPSELLNIVQIYW